VSATASRLQRIATTVARLEARTSPPAVPDPVTLAARCGLQLDPWQREALASTAPRCLWNASRQSGKSTIAALLGLHTALVRPRALVLMVSPSLRQSSELFRKCLYFYRALERPIPAQAETSLRLELDNGSRIISLPGSEATIRGYSAVTLLLLDEAARIEDTLYSSLRPMLAVSGGRLVALSTPHGTRGWWFEAWRGEESWERYEVPATMCPRISAAFLAEEQRTMGQWWFEQEYECRFSDAETQPFGREDVERCFREEVEPWDLS
jgi:Terminase large subunit, T4likevirus-type, N-terminal